MANSAFTLTSGGASIPPVLRQYTGGAGRAGVTTKSAGGGGEGAAMVTMWIPAASLPATGSISIGLGGAGGVGNLATGSNGGHTTFDALMVARGGAGGPSATSTASSTNSYFACTSR